MAAAVGLGELSDARAREVAGARPDPGFREASHSRPDVLPGEVAGARPDPGFSRAAPCKDGAQGAVRFNRPRALCLRETRRLSIRARA